MNRLLWFYKIYGLTLLTGLYFLMIAIQISSTTYGIRTGDFTVTLRTNDFHENFFELALELASLPAVLLILADLILRLSRPAGATEAKK